MPGLNSCENAEVWINIEGLRKHQIIKNVLWILKIIDNIPLGNQNTSFKLEDLKVLGRSPDLLNNVKIGQGQLQLLMEQILFLPYTFWSSDLNNLMNPGHRSA